MLPRVTKSPSADPNSTGVLYYWSIELDEHSSSPLPHSLIPSPYFDLIFPVRGGIDVRYARTRYDRPFLSTLLSMSMPLEFDPGTRIFGIRVIPEFTSLHITPQVHELSFGPNDLAMVLSKRKYGKIADVVNMDNSFHEKCLALDLLLGSWACARSRDARLDKVIHMARSMRGSVNIRISDLYEEVQGSARTNSEIFFRHMGTSPKKYQQLVRFNNALLMARSRENSNLAQIADAAGYADQAHFTRACRTYAGTSPTRLASNDWLADQFNHL